ncbi:MAG: hypothetical protein ACYCTV_09000 [Leptospirales bacterium]
MAVHRDRKDWTVHTKNTKMSMPMTGVHMFFLMEGRNDSAHAFGGWRWIAKWSGTPSLYRSIRVHPTLFEEIFEQVRGGSIWLLLIAIRLL